MALNTILTDRELPEALDIIQEVFRAGADGLIIQDVGLLELDLPPIPLIASTQMHNNTPEKVQFLETAGFKRVILARELSLEGKSPPSERRPGWSWRPSSTAPYAFPIAGNAT